MTCPAVPVPTPLRWLTARLTSLIASSARTSDGRMLVDPKRNWRSTSLLPGTASALCCPWRVPPWLPSTVAMGTTCNSSPEAKGQAHPISSAPSSLLSSTTKWMFFLGSSARVTGVGIMRPGLPITDRSAQKALLMRTILNSSKRPGNTKAMLVQRHKCTDLPTVTQFF